MKGLEVIKFESVKKVSMETTGGECPDFWENKYKHDFGDIEFSGDWKILYLRQIKYNNKYRQVGFSTPLYLFGSAEKVNVAQIAFGGGHGLVRDNNMNVYSFGKNNFGQLGLGDYTDRSQLVQLLQITAKQIACGSHHSALIDNDDYVWTFGNNYFHQLALGGKKENRIFCEDHQCYVVKDIYFDPDMVNAPVKIDAKKVQYITCGNDSTVIISMGKKHIKMAGTLSNTNDYNFIRKNIVTKNDIEDLFNFDFNCYSNFSPILLEKNQPAMKTICHGDGFIAGIDIKNNVWIFADSGFYDKSFKFMDMIEAKFGYIKYVKIPSLKAKNITIYKNLILIITTDDKLYKLKRDHHELKEVVQP